MFGGPSFENITWQQFFPTQVPSGQFKIFDDGSIGGAFQSSIPLRSTDQAKLELSLRDDINSPGSLDDGVTDPLPWDPAAGLGQLIKTVTGGGQGGLTDQQNQALQEIHQSTFPSDVIDALTLTNLTPGGPSPGPVNAQLVDPIFGLIIRIASLPPGLDPITPDGDYFLPTLCSVRIFRGQDLWLRVPVHTSSKIISVSSEWLQVGVASIWGSTWPLQLSLQVNFLAGVTGSVFLINIPIG